MPSGLSEMRIILYNSALLNWISYLYTRPVIPAPGGKGQSHGQPYCIPYNSHKDKYRRRIKNVGLFDIRNVLMFLSGDGKLHTAFFPQISEVLSTLAWAGQCQILTLVLQHIAVEISFSRLLETLQYVNLFLLFYLLVFLKMNKIMMYLWLRSFLF